jgi:hypothetical protein
MAQKALTRAQCEDAILRHMKEIQQLYKRYHPNGDYLTITIFGDDMSANNAHWEEKDEEHPLDFYFIKGEKGTLFNGK